MRFNSHILGDNPIVDRFGYNNLCVGWDEPPALYVAPVFLVAIAYLAVRYAYLDQLRSNIDARSSKAQKRVQMFGNIYFAASFVCLPLIFVITPHVNVEMHTGLFLNLILALMLMQWGNTYEARGRGAVDAKALIYLAALSVASLGILVLASIQLVMYDAETKERGPVPPRALQFFDLMWFACLPLGGWFKPKDTCIKFVCSRGDDMELSSRDIASPKSLDHIPPTTSIVRGRGWGGE